VIAAQGRAVGEGDADQPPGGAAEIAPAATAAPDTAVTWDEAISILDGIPGIGRQVAEQLAAELGVNMDQFPTAGHAAKWARLAPSLHESAGKRYSTRIGQGNRWLRGALLQAAWAAVKVKESYLRPSTSGC
jgi:transposase